MTAQQMVDYGAFFDELAKISIEKTAMGQRQMKRVLEAVVRKGGERSPLRHELLQRSGETMGDLAWYARPKEQIPMAIQDVLHRKFSPLLNATYEPDLVKRTALVKSLRGSKRFRAAADVQENALRGQTVTSGRHHPEDVVRLKAPTEFTPETSHQALSPVENVGWKGGLAETHAPKTSLWYSGSPNVSSQYMENRLGYFSPSTSRLRAYDLNNVPKNLQTPWTGHLGTDPWAEPQKWKAQIKSGKSPFGESALDELPRYEKVVRSQANPPLLAEYKPIGQGSDVFMRTRGQRVPMQAGSIKPITPEQPKIRSVAPIKPSIKPITAGNG